MFKQSLSLLLFALVVGLVAGCGSSNPLADRAKSNIEDQNYQAALDAAEQSITERPQDPLGYYYKAVALGNLADEQPADQRESYYQRMNESFEEAREVAANMEDPGDAPAELENIEVVKTAVWRTEHNQAIAYATDDSLQQVTPNFLDVAISHLENATVVRPDSMLSWDVMAQVYGLQENYGRAAEIKGKVMNNSRFDPDTLDYLDYARYLRLDNRSEDALPVLEEASERYPESTVVVSALADVYMETGNADQAMATVRSLIEQDPENPQYRLSLGTQIYQTALISSDSLDANIQRIYEIQDSVRNGQLTAQEANPRLEEILAENEELRSRMEELTEEAVAELEMVIERRPDDVRAYNTMGIIYQNWAASVMDQRNLTTDNEKAAMLQERVDEYLREAMGYYEKAAELDPDNIEVWQSLYSIYVNLGMEEKAAEAEKKAGMN